METTECRQCKAFRIGACDELLFATYLPRSVARVMLRLACVGGPVEWLVLKVMHAWITCRTRAYFCCECGQEFLRARSNRQPWGGAYAVCPTCRVKIMSEHAARCARSAVAS